jgi:hypothetical protein
MRKIVLSLAALVAMAIAIPYVGSAQAEDTVVIKKRHDHYWNMAPRHDKTVIIKRGHRDTVTAGLAEFGANRHTETRVEDDGGRFRARHGVMLYKDAPTTIRFRWRRLGGMH